MKSNVVFRRLEMFQSFLVLILRITKQHTFSAKKKVILFFMYGTLYLSQCICFYMTYLMTL